MATAIQMPALSPTMTEGKITRWLKKEGDKVSSGEAIAEVETDKSNLEIESYEDGFLLQIAVKENESAAVGAAIGYVGAKGEKVPAGGQAAKPAPQAPAAAAPAAKPAPAAPAVKSVAAAPVAQAAKPAVVPAAAPSARPAPAASGRRVRVSPLARKMARVQGLELEALSGSGPNGRIVKRDIEAALKGGVRKAPAAVSAAPLAARAQPTATPMSTMRKVIAQRLGEVKPGVPHFYLTVEVEMDAAMKVREEAKALEVKVSVNDVIVKATAVALRQFPKINVQYAGDSILQLTSCDVGVAVAIEDGLITPIIRDADQKGLGQISAETRDLAERARKKSLKPAEYTGGSITVSNLGMFGIDEFIAVLNPPQAAILAIGAVAEKPVVRGGQIVVRKMMSITLSGDHRVIDGAVGAQYLQVLKGLLESPLRLLF